MTEELFRLIDYGSDGKISEWEFYEMFYLFDTNSDEKITEEELISGTIEYLHPLC